MDLIIESRIALRIEVNLLLSQEDCNGKAEGAGGNANGESFRRTDQVIRIAGKMKP
jgi:hypothetical protein